MSSLTAEFSGRGHHPSDEQLKGLEDVVVTLEAMAEGRSDSKVHLSSLDPGVGKTTAVIHFTRHLLASPAHQDVGVLICLPRIEEIERVVYEMGLNDADYAVFTRDDDANSWSSTPPNLARVLFTTQQMVLARCRGRSFSEAKEFHFSGLPREVRVWDEGMLPGEVVSISSDDVASLLKPAQRCLPALAEMLEWLYDDLRKQKPGAVFQWPSIDETCRINRSAIREAMKQSLTEGQRMVLDALLWMSGRVVRIAMQNGRIRTALDYRDTLPDDLAPIVVLDASGRVRGTYDLWEAHRGGLVRLRSATKNYSDLTIHVLGKGGGKDSWRNNEERLLAEVASVIDTKPDEPWLVIHHRDACNGKFADALGSRLATDACRVSYLPWGRHQGTNEHADIPNVVLAGTLFLPEGQYQGLAHMASATPVGSELPEGAVEAIRSGEHGDLLLQGLCRASVRGSAGASCRPCNAYVIISKGSGIRDTLPEVFPGCRVRDWKPKHKPLRGKVADAVVHLETRLGADPQAVTTFAELMKITRCENKANFNRTIRNHPDFMAARDRLGLDEVATDGARHKNALQRPFGPIPGATFIGDL